MPRELLTDKGLQSKLKAALAKAAAEQTRVQIGDGDNLMLVVRPNGGASWVLNYRSPIDGKRKPFTIGPWPDVTLKKAREKADSLRGQVVDGIDPLLAKVEVREAAKAEEVKEKAQQDTVLALMDDWMRIDCAPKSATYRDNIRAAFKKDVLPAIGFRPPHEVTRLDILGILRAIEDRNSLDMVRRVRMWMAHMFEFGVAHETRPLLTASPVPTGQLRAFRAHKKGHYAAITDPKAIPALVQALHDHDRPIVRACLLLAMHTFQRPTELRCATWDEFDLQTAVWTIPVERTKKDREHWVPLSTQVVEMLRRHQGVVGNTGLLFPGQVRGQPISEDTALRALHRLGFKGEQTVHGMRATARTIAEERLQMSDAALEKQLAHVYDKSGMKGAYNRAEWWHERVRLMQVWSDWLDEQLQESYLTA